MVISYVSWYHWSNNKDFPYYFEPTTLHTGARSHLCADKHLNCQNLCLYHFRVEGRTEVNPFPCSMAVFFFLFVCYQERNFLSCRSKVLIESRGYYAKSWDLPRKEVCSWTKMRTLKEFSLGSFSRFLLTYLAMGIKSDVQNSGPMLNNAMNAHQKR